MKLIKKIKRKLGSPKTRPLIASSGLANLPSIRFHPVHGDNVRLGPDGLEARRVESFCKGVVFGHRPVMVNERISLRITELSTSWSGALRFGFTSVDPTCHRKSGLPKYACPDLTNLFGYWAKALNERYAAVDAILSYWVNEEGDVKYSINGQDKGLFFTGVSTSGRLWPLLDIYGNTTGVEFINSRLDLNNSINRTFASTNSSNAEVQLLTQLASSTRNLSSSTLPRATSNRNVSNSRSKANCPPTNLNGSYSHLAPAASNMANNQSQEAQLLPALIAALAISGNSSRTQLPVNMVGLIQQALNLSNSSSPPTNVKRCTDASPVYETLYSSSSHNQDREVNSSNECTVCYEQPINSVLYMCGHMCMCYSCAYKQWKGHGQCPICRATILDVVKTYWS
ncbi:Protein neuralized [Halotydeus destructor]|nr:Protein neuralized [Halotydeus destructor]